MGSYSLSELASSDLDEIYEYGILNFGLPQAQDYLFGLHDYMQLLADSPALGRSAEQPGSQTCVCSTDPPRNDMFHIPDFAQLDI